MCQDFSGQTYLDGYSDGMDAAALNATADLAALRAMVRAQDVAIARRDATIAARDEGLPNT